MAVGQDHDIHGERVLLVRRIGTNGRVRSVLGSKIHKATVTHADVAYVGSITIDSELCELVDLWPGEKVLVVSNTSGVRLETYVIYGEAGSGTVQMNGAAAHLVNVGEEIIVISFQLTDEPIEPKQILVDEKNAFVQRL